MSNSVKIIEDSINPYNGIRLTTMQLRYWRAYHSELLTHRVFSKNASSSRAIPISKTIKQVWNDPAGPTHWGSNQPGMKAREELTGFKRVFAQKTWKYSSRLMCSLVWLVNKVSKPHKQTFNRLLEPWQYISVVITGTEWDNFFELRDHEDALPEFRMLTKEMKKCLNESIPKKIQKGEWHLPYINEEEKLIYGNDICIKMSAARCCRVSYLKHNGEFSSVDDDLKLFNKLAGAKPRHLSPLEHQATPIDTYPNRHNLLDAYGNKYSGNLKGWLQYRHLFLQEETGHIPPWSF